MGIESMRMVGVVRRRLVKSSSFGLSSHVSFHVFFWLELHGLIDFTVVAGMIVYGVWDSCVRGNNRRPPHAGNGYGGGWGGDDDNNGKTLKLLQQDHWQDANRNQMMHHHHTHRMANQAQVATTVHRMDKAGDLGSGLVLGRELLQVPLRDTWLGTEQVAHAVALPDRTVEDGEAAQAQALLHHHRRDTKALVSARAAADKITLDELLVAIYPY
jgi:hypothetical protein